jgi:hypothetical protein
MWYVLMRQDRDDGGQKTKHDKGWEVLADSID